MYMRVIDFFLKNRVKIFTFTFSVVLFLPLFALAETGGLVPCTGPDCTMCDLATLVQKIINLLVTISVSIAAVLFAYAGIMYVFAGGDPGKIKSAHSIFFDVFIGLVIILSAWLIVNLIMMALLKETYLPWNEIC